MRDINSYICLTIGILILIFRKQYVNLIIKFHLWRSNIKLKKQIKALEPTYSPYLNFMVILGGLIFFIVGLLTLLGVWEFRN